MLMSRGLLFGQFGVATLEVEWNVHPWLYGDDHPWRQDGVPVHSESVVSVHAKEVTHMMRIKTIHDLQNNITDNATH